MAEKVQVCGSWEWHSQATPQLSQAAVSPTGQAPLEHNEIHRPRKAWVNCTHDFLPVELGFILW